MVKTGLRAALSRWARRWSTGPAAARRSQNDDPRRRSPGSSDIAIRLFVSSTFRDMNDEREALRRHVFPIIQRICEERGVSFFEIDLRWGVTKEEALGGRVLSICLEEIDRCRPFVLGIMGSRYGWIDPDAAQVIASHERFGALLPHASCSVTELELRYAILNRPHDAPTPVAVVYRRPTEPDDAGRLEGAGFEPLIGALRAFGVPTRPTPEGLDDFARQVRSDLLTVIKARLPPRPVTASERARVAGGDLAIALAHRFVESASSREAVTLLRRRAPRIAIVGPPGSGKSMIAAALVRTMQSGGVPGADVVAALRPAGWGNWSDAFQSLILQMQDAPAGAPATSAPENWRHAALQGMLAAAAERRFMVAVIDGVDDRNISESALPSWSLAPIANATIVMTLRGDARSIQALVGAGWSVVALSAFAREEARELSEKFFAPYGRRLAPEQLAELTRRPRVALELSLMLEELRLVGRFEDLPNAITRIGSAADASTLFGLVLDRLERDHGRPVMAALEALALAPDGLPEPVLRSTAGEPGQPLLQLTFQILLRSIGGIAAVTFDRVTLRSPLLGDLILRRLPDAAAARQAIIDRLRGDIHVAGAAEELLRQLLLLGRWQEMLAALSDRAIFDGLARRAPQQLLANWATLMRIDSRYTPAIYRDWIGTDPTRRVAEAALLAEQLGLPDLALELAQDAVARARDVDRSAFAVGASVLAGVAERRGNFAGAIELLQAIEAPEITAEVPQASAVAALRRARIMLARADDAAAERDLERAAEAIARIGDDRLRAVHVAMRAAIAIKTRDLRAARRMFDDLLALGDRLGDLAVVASAETGYAKLARQQGKLDRADAAAGRARRLARVIGDDRLLQDALGVAAKVYIELSNLDAADSAIRERLAITRKIGDAIGELEAKVDLARVYAQLSFKSDGERIMASVKEKANRLGLAVPRWED